MKSARMVEITAKSGHDELRAWLVSLPAMRVEEARLEEQWK